MRNNHSLRRGRRQNLWTRIKHGWRPFWRSIKEKSILLFNKLLRKMGSETALEDTWKILRPLSIRVISVVIVLILFLIGFSYGNRMLFKEMNRHDDSPMLFVINKGASMSSVARNLKEVGLLRSSWGIKLLADFTNVSSKVQSGEYILDRTMDAQTILAIITRPAVTTTTVTVTLVEGINLDEMARQLFDSGVITSTEAFLAACKSAVDVGDYYFLKDATSATGIKYALEGYLFPDTYEFYVGSTAKVAIQRLLDRLSEIYTPAYTERADKIGMSMQQVLTLASVIEKEGTGADFSKVSAVFHNRLNKGMKLESDATVQYALGTSKLVLTSDELATDSPYNTYLVSGLPAGPICCPGKNAILAALYPDEEITNGGYLYFTLTDPYTGELAFSKTYAEHQALKAKYQSSWAEYDKAHGYH